MHTRVAPPAPSPPYRRSAAQHQAGHGCQNQRDQEGFQEQVLRDSPRHFFNTNQKDVAAKSGLVSGLERPLKHLKNSNHGLSPCKSHFMFDLAT